MSLCRWTFKPGPKSVVRLLSPPLAESRCCVEFFVEKLKGGYLGLGITTDTLKALLGDSSSGAIYSSGMFGFRNQLESAKGMKLSASFVVSVPSFDVSSRPKDLGRVIVSKLYSKIRSWSLLLATCLSLLTSEFQSFPLVLLLISLSENRWRKSLNSDCVFECFEKKKKWEGRVFKHKSTEFKKKKKNGSLSGQLNITESNF